MRECLSSGHHEDGTLSFKTIDVRVLLLLQEDESDHAKRCGVPAADEAMRTEKTSKRGIENWCSVATGTFLLLKNATTATSHPVFETSKSPLRKSPNLQIANPLYLCRFPDDSGRQATIDYSGLNPTLFTKRPSRGGFFGIHVVRAFWGFRGRSWPLSLFPLPRPTESAATRSSSEAGHIARSIQDRLSRAFASVPREQNCRQVES